MRDSILVVEDEPAIQQLIAATLGCAGFGVLPADSAEHALLMLQHVLPALMLVDWGLPGQSGIDLVRRLRASVRTRALPIIMLTARTQQEDIIFGLESGVDDYVTKPFSPRELLARIQTQLRQRHGAAVPATMEINGLRLDPVTQSVSAGAHALPLGAAEFSLLQYLMRHPQRIHSRSMLLQQVWGNDSDVDERAVDTRVGRLRRSLEASGHAAMIETVRGGGYRLTAP